jgi:hypothetical protein
MADAEEFEVATGLLGTSSDNMKPQLSSFVCMVFFSFSNVGLSAGCNSAADDGQGIGESCATLACADGLSCMSLASRQPDGTEQESRSCIKPCSSDSDCNSGCLGGTGGRCSEALGCGCQL